MLRTLTRSLGSALLLVSLCVPVLSAQSGTAEQLDAEKAKNYLYLVRRLAPNSEGKYSFEYSIDEQASIDVLSPLPDLLTISANRRRGLNVLLNYLNPIRFSWTATETTSDDPTYHAAQQFLNSALGLFSTLEGSSSGAGPSASQASNVNRALRNANRIQLEKQPVFANTALLEWSQWLAERDSCFRSASDRDGLKDKLGLADAMIFGSDSTGLGNSIRTATQFRRGTLGTLQLLAGAESVVALHAALLNTADSLKALRSANSDARLILSAITPLGTDTWNPAHVCTNFAAYTNDVLATFRNQASDRVGAREKVISEMSLLRGKVDTLVTQEVDGNHDFFRVMNVNIPAGKTKDVTLTLSEREVTIADDKLSVSEKVESKLIFRVQERQSFVLEFAPGIAHTDVHYPKYGTSGTGSNLLVVSAGDEIQHTAAVGMLNLIPNFGNGLSYLIGQIGIGTGKDYPLLLAGGGIRLMRPVQFSLTAGAAWGWARALTKLKLQDPVSGTAAIENDLTYQLQPPRIYVAVQHGF